MSDCGPTGLNQKACTCRRLSKAGGLEESDAACNHYCCFWSEPFKSAQPPYARGLGAQTRTTAGTSASPNISPTTLVFLVPPWTLIALLTWLYCISLTQFVSCSLVLGAHTEAPTDFPGLLGTPTAVAGPLRFPKSIIPGQEKGC